MLSVILYGRNDSHGYNLHKRAAISLNAIAHLLSDPDDEIVFVDYNTPDDLPTFPEAIADTLTDNAQDRLRILRVRPGVHEPRFGGRTHLAALEPIARNIAIRRSNPANRWVLSTNTDMIFCPAPQHSGLTSVVSSLKDGFYHLPRFELPEGLWESLDRKDPDAVIAAARDWGQRFHLNEITLADRKNLYDAPGDFQLFLRQDLFEIDGFHEEMILGWHLDANMAKRMSLKRGVVSSALDHLIGYHCDHTRQASIYHRADRAENDQVRFDDMVSVAEIPEQRDTWGMPELEIESFTLKSASGARYIRGLQAAVREPLDGYLQTQYLLEDYGRIQYTPGHVLPYLLDLVSCLPPRSRIGWIGGRSDILQMFLHAWAAMDGAPVLVPQDADWLDTAGLAAERVAPADWLARSDVLVFDISAENATHHLDLSAEESARLWQVDHAFKAAVDGEAGRRAAGRGPRRVLVVNGVHNFFEPQMMTELAVTLTPYSSRVRHGYIVNRAADRTAAASPAQRQVMRVLGALEPVSRSDMKRFADLLDALRGAGGPEALQDAGAMRVELEALIATGLLGAGLDTTDLIGQIHRAQPSSRAGSGQTGLSPEAGKGAATRLVRLEDWDDPQWARVARRLFSNRNHASPFGRDAWTWERVSLAQNLMSAVPSDPASPQRILVTGQAPELLAFALAHQGYRVDIADPAALVSGALRSIDWRSDFTRHGWVSPEPVGRIEDRAAEIAGGFRYDAVLLPHSGVFARGRRGAAAVLRQASALLKVGGHLGFAALAQPLTGDDRLSEGAVPRTLTAGGALSRALGDLTDLQPDGAVDARLTPRSLDRARLTERPDSKGPSALMRGTGALIETPGVWALRKADQPADWDALERVLGTADYGVADPSSGPAAHAAPAGPALFTAEEIAAAPQSDAIGQTGSRFDTLIPAGGLRKTPMAVQTPAGFSGIAAGAALGKLAAAAYEISVEILVNAAGEAPQVAAVCAVAEGRVLAEASLENAGKGAHRLVLPFEVGKEGRRGVAVLIKAAGGTDFDVLNLALR